MEVVEAKLKNHTIPLGSSNCLVSLSKGVCCADPGRWRKRGTSVGDKPTTLAGI